MGLITYLGKTKGRFSVLALMLIMSSFACLSASAVDLYDNFDRPDSVDLGTTQDAGAYSWFKTQAPSQIMGGMLSMPNGGNVGIEASSVDGTLFRPADFDFTSDVKVDWSPGVSSGVIGVSYRQNANIDPGYGNGGYMAFIFGGGDVSLYSSWTGHAWSPTPIESPDWSVFHSIRVRAVGNHHEAWFDDQKIIDFFDESPGAKNSGGYFYLTPSTPGEFPLRFDNFRITTDVVPEPASAIVLLCGLSGLLPLRRIRARS